MQPLGSEHVLADQLVKRGESGSPGTDMVRQGGDVEIDAIERVSGKPKAPGDIVQVCVDNVAFTPIAGAYKDKPVVVTGLFSGGYCGEVSW